MPSQHGRVSIVYAHGYIGTDARRLLHMNSAGTIYDGGFPLGDADLRRSLSLQSSPGTVISWLVRIDDEKATDVSTIDGVLARILRAGSEQLPRENSLIVYVYSSSLTALLGEPGYAPHTAVLERGIQDTRTPEH